MFRQVSERRKLGAWTLTLDFLRYVPDNEDCVLLESLVVGTDQKHKQVPQRSVLEKLEQNFPNEVNQQKKTFCKQHFETFV